MNKAEKIRKLAKRGMSRHEIAAAVGCIPEYVRDTLARGEPKRRRPGCPKHLAYTEAYRKALRARLPIEEAQRRGREAYRGVQR